MLVVFCVVERMFEEMDWLDRIDVGEVFRENGDGVKCSVVKEEVVGRSS